MVGATRRRKGYIMDFVVSCHLILLFILCLAGFSQCFDAFTGTLENGTSKSNSPTLYTRLSFLTTGTTRTMTIMMMTLAWLTVVSILKQKSHCRCHSTLLTGNTSTKYKKLSTTPVTLRMQKEERS